MWVDLYASLYGIFYYIIYYYIIFEITIPMYPFVFFAGKKILLKLLVNINNTKKLNGYF